ncbi:hypothetical protein [Profundibacter amoris]|uniref:DUF2238 domain-containing protein n=1 Tax=Profundibacter amoris TaxID=2171755 RepID=A0A347UFI8_9RHOB|nr:hypothetical protein [Profundibacter amoris]AXX97616.1 hypothetical protein BAR1_06520 [Profundibacter amoris]
MKLGKQSYVVYLIWAVLALEFVVSMFEGRYSLAFIALATLSLSLAPMIFADRFHIRLPVRFFAGIVLFIFGTVYLGEAFDFYEKYWWWDVLLHGGSALGFGLIGFIFVFILFEGDRYAAPPWALSFMAFAIAVSIGVMWEIFEFAMDQIFGLNMQKSGLIDTMWDLIVDVIGAFIGAWAGYGFLQGRDKSGLAGMIREFVSKNRRLFRRRKR